MISGLLLLVGTSVAQETGLSPSASLNLVRPCERDADCSLTKVIIIIVLGSNQFEDVLPVEILVQALKPTMDINRLSLVVLGFHLHAPDVSTDLSCSPSALRPARPDIGNDRPMVALR